MSDTDVNARRIVGFGLTSSGATRLADFYATAFGARRVSSEHVGGVRFERTMGVHGGALRHILRLGLEAIDILQFDTPGRPYPRLLFPDDTAFQHFAIVVSSMDLALAQLRKVSGWVPISIGGPQRLPQGSGGVAAFKFQDPDGHPLELLEFPEHAVPPHWAARSAYGVFLGIDHSAISVRDTATSTAFYQSLGFAVTGETFNHGKEQANLDGVPSPQVEVTALTLAASNPHLELLCYRSGIHLPRRILSSNDVAATRVALGTEGLRNNDDTTQRIIVDPDGHHLLFVP